MIDPGNIFLLKLTVTDSFPEIWRRVLVPDECTLGDLHYVISYAFGWFDDSEHEFSQDNYPCCIAGNNDGPPDGIGGISRHNEVVKAFANPDAWKALLAEVGWPAWMQRGFEPTYLDIGDINGALGLIFPAHHDADGFLQINPQHTLSK